MQDRIPSPGQEGRTLITPENGSAPFYAILAMADNPTQHGTPLNKENLLKDATAALFGGDSSMVPDQVLAKIAEIFEEVENNISDIQSVGAKIEVGSYVGTGSKTNTRTFSFPPQVIFITDGDSGIYSDDSGYNANNGIMLVRSQSGVYVNASSAQNSLSFSGNTMTLFHAAGASQAFNRSGGTYHYYVIGQ